MELKQQQGFTLIEMLVYLGLFALLIGGAVAAAYSVMESSGRNQTQAMLEEESNFLIGKINWALSGIDAVNAPLLNAALSPSNLLVSKSDPAIGGVSINLTGSDMTMSSSGNPAVPLNNSNISIMDLAFDHRDAPSGAEWVTATMTLSAKTPDGQTINRDFSATKYLRK